MALVTTPVYAIFLDSTNNPIVDALVTVQLNRTDIEDGGIVVPAYQEFRTDATGRVDMNLWPNERGATSSAYVVRAWKKDGTRILQVETVVPETALEQNLTDISTLPNYPGKGDGALAVESASEAAADAKEWAITPEDTPVPAGNGVDEYSSLHHASKSSASASAASTSETNAAASASAASTSEANAGTSETNAAASEAAAAASETNAASSESNAASSEINAGESATEAQNWANTPEDTLVPEGDQVDDYSALHQAAKAAGSASSAASSASAASTSEANAAASESSASTSETNAANSASAASTSETNAAAAEAAAESLYDDFDDRYLGPKSSNPSTDNDGNALKVGALYFNTVSGDMRVWDGSQWLVAYDLSPAGNAGWFASAVAASQEWEEQESFFYGESLLGVDEYSNNVLAVGANGFICNINNDEVLDSPITHELTSSAYDSNLDLWAICSNNSPAKILTSPGITLTGASWTERTPDSGDNLKSIVSDDAGTFVAVGGGFSTPVIVRSTDGTTWTSQTVPAGVSNRFSSVIWDAANSLFIAGSEDGSIITSPDGATWTERTTGSTHIRCIETDGVGRITAFGESGNLITSTDGVNWTTLTSPLPDTSHVPVSIVYHNDKWATYILDGRVLSSMDGQSWVWANNLDMADGEIWDGTRGMVVGRIKHSNISYSSGIWVGDDPTALEVKKTPEFTQFTSGEDGSGNPLHLFLSANEPLFGATHHLGRWVSRKGSNFSSKWDIEWHGGLWLVGGTGGMLQTSPDAITWTDRSVHSFTNYEVVAGGGVYLALAADFVSDPYLRIYRSTDGVSFSEVSHGLPTGNYYCRSSVYANSQFVIGLSNGGIATSPDGSSWTLRTTPASDLIWSVIYAGETFAAVTQTMVMYSTDDGITWTEGTVNDPGDDSYNGIAVSAEIWVLVDNNVGQWVSSDGIEWNRVRSRKYRGGGRIFAADNRFLMSPSDGVSVCSTPYHPTL